MRDDTETETVHVAPAIKDNNLDRVNHQADGNSAEQDKENRQVGSPKAKPGCE